MPVTPIRIGKPRPPALSSAIGREGPARPTGCRIADSAASQNIWESEFFSTRYPLPTIAVGEPEEVCGAIYRKDRSAVEVLAEYPKEMARLKQAAARLKTGWRALCGGGTASFAFCLADSLSLLPAGNSLVLLMRQVGSFAGGLLLISFFWGWKCFAINQRQQGDLILEKQRAQATIAPERPAGS